MAGICSLSLNRVGLVYSKPDPFPVPTRIPPLCSTRPINSYPLLTPRTAYQAPASSSAAAAAPENDQIAAEDAMSVDNLRRFIKLNLGRWTGSFHQFDPNGILLYKISTKLASASYGDDDLISLIQTLYIRQPQSTTSISGDAYEPEWAEYKIKETNMYTVDKYQQFADWFFPQRKGLCT